MLAGVEQAVLDAVRRPGLGVVAIDCRAHHGRLHKLWPHSDDGQKLLHKRADYWFSKSCSAGTSRHTRAGEPKTILRAGTSRVTTEPAATRASSPSVSPGSTVTLAPMRAPRFMVTPL